METVLNISGNKEREKFLWLLEHWGGSEESGFTVWKYSQFLNCVLSIARNVL